MVKFTIGRRKKTNSYPSENRSSISYAAEKILVSIGICAVAASLCMAVFKGDSLSERGENSTYAVPVMSGGVDGEGNTEKEKLSDISYPSSANGEWSIYDYIGELIASLIPWR